MAKTIETHRAETIGIVRELLARAQLSLLRDDPVRAAVTVRRLTIWEGRLHGLNGNFPGS